MVTGPLQCSSLLSRASTCWYLLSQLIQLKRMLCCQEGSPSELRLKLPSCGARGGSGEGENSTLSWFPCVADSLVVLFVWQNISHGRNGAVQNKLTGPNSRRLKGSVLCLPAWSVSQEPKWVLKIHPNLTKCCCSCLNLPSLCLKKQSSTFVFAPQQSNHFWHREENLGAELDTQNRRANQLESIQQDTPCKKLVHQQDPLVFLFSSKPKFNFVGEDEKSKSPISIPGRHKSLSSHMCSCAVATQSGSRQWGEIERALSSNKQNIHWEFRRETWLPNSALPRLLCSSTSPSSFLRKNK